MQRMIIGVGTAILLWLFIIPPVLYGPVTLVLMVTVAAMLAMGMNKQEQIERQRYNRDGEIV